jgi:hypothetical protein
MTKSSRLRRYKSHFVLVLIVAVCSLAIANLLKHGVAVKSAIVQNKDFIDAISKILGATALAIGAVASYYRFFRGRTFAAKADLNLEVAVYETDQDFRLHVINLEVTNLGPVPISEPRPQIDVYLYGPSGTKKYSIDKWWHPLDEDGEADNVSLIDSQESSQFHSSQHIPNEIWAVLYVARVESDRNDTWSRAITVSNRVSHHNSSEASRV